MFRSYASPKSLESMRAEVERVGMYCSQETFDFYNKIKEEHPDFATGRIDTTFDKYIAYLKEKENVS